MQDGLYYRLSYLSIEVVELSRVVPRHLRAVIAVVDIFYISRIAVKAFKNNGGIRLVPVAILYKNAYPFVFTEICSVKGVRWKWKAVLPMLRLT